MVLTGHLPIGLFQLVVGRGSFDAQGLVVVSLGHGCRLSWVTVQQDRAPCIDEARSH